MSEISFTSAIRPVSLRDFSSAVTKIGSKHSVNYPWTINESIKAQAAYTTNICDCTMLGISDGENVLMMHICPTVEQNHNLFSLKQFIARHINLKNTNLEGMLIGSKMNKKSQEIYEKLSNLLQNFKIPYSELKIGKDPIKTAYSSQTDEWIVSSPYIDKLLKKGTEPLSVLNSTFEKVKIADTDEVV